MKLLVETAIQQGDKEVKSTIILDPSDKFRPEKEEQYFRDFTSNNAYYERVKETYRLMHTHQTYDYAKGKKESWCQFNRAEMTCLEVLEQLNALVDESDPDVDIPNSLHAFQTAERIREVHPDNEWFQLTGLIHDIGKIMAIWGEPQYSTVGDTFVLGCEFSDEIVFGTESFKENPDYTNPKYMSKCGVYEEGCGLENVVMSWGHDEYLYNVLKNTPQCTLPEEALFIIKNHSFYPWHTGKAYQYLNNDKDNEMLKWVLEFNKFDLYSKADKEPNMEELVPYYQSLIDKYVPGKLKW